MGRAKGAVQGKGQKRKRVKDPNKPKRATTAYFYYLSSERELAKKEGRESNRIAEFTKQISAKWRALSEDERKPFEDKAATDKARYQDQMKIFTGKDPDKPKRPQSAYFIFLGEFRNKHKGQYAHKDILRKAGEKWNQMSTEDKKPFEEGAEKGRKVYEEKMKNYNSGATAAKKAKVESKNGAAVEEDEDDEDEEEEEDEEDEDEDDE